MSGTCCFAEAYLAVIAGLWRLLEHWLWRTRHLPGSQAVPSADAQGLQALLLELALLYESASAGPLRRLVTAAQSDRVRRLAEGLWKTLDVLPFESSLDAIRDAIVRAQDQLFEEARSLLPAAADLQPAGTPSGCGNRASQQRFVESSPCEVRAQRIPA